MLHNRATPFKCECGAIKRCECGRARTYLGYDSGPHAAGHVFAYHENCKGVKKVV